jgi:ABC-type branched-subunit amino acid transport system substrate-binding protein
MSRRRNLVLPLLAFVLAGCSSRSATEQILIGHIAPLDKPAGEHAKQGIVLAVEEVNEGDKVGGQKLTVLHVDTHGDGTIAQAEAVRLVTINKVVGLLVDAEPGRVERIGKELEPYNVPVLTPDVLSAAPAADNLFAFNLTAAQRGGHLARFTAEHLKPARVAVLADQRSAIDIAFASSFVKEIPKDGPVRVEQWTFENTAVFPDLASRVKKMQPEAVVFAGMGADLPALRGQLQNAELRAPILFSGDDFMAITSDSRENVYLATCFAPEKVAHDQEFIRKYRDRFRETPDIHAALAYEAIRTMCKALNQTKLVTGQEMRKELIDTPSFPGLLGPLSFEKDRTVRRTSVILHWKDGQAKVEQP